MREGIAGVHGLDFFSPKKNMCNLPWQKRFIISEGGSTKSHFNRDTDLNGWLGKGMMKFLYGICSVYVYNK